MRKKISPVYNKNIMQPFWFSSGKKNNTCMGALHTEDTKPTEVAQQIPMYIKNSLCTLISSSHQLIQLTKAI